MSVYKIQAAYKIIILKAIQQQRPSRRRRNVQNGRTGEPVQLITEHKVESNSKGERESEEG